MVTSGAGFTAVSLGRSIAFGPAVAVVVQGAQKVAVELGRGVFLAHGKLQCSLGPFRAGDADQ